jgi:hypothetical protein
MEFDGLREKSMLLAYRNLGIAADTKNLEQVLLVDNSCRLLARVMRIQSQRCIPSNAYYSSKTEPE